MAPSVFSVVVLTWSRLVEGSWASEGLWPGWGASHVDVNSSIFGHRVAPLRAVFAGASGSGDFLVSSLTDGEALRVLSKSYARVILAGCCLVLGTLVSKRMGASW